MFGAIRAATAPRAALRSFSTSTARKADLAKIILIGHLGKEPEAKQTKNNAEYVTYSVATRNYPPPPPDANGERQQAKTTWHRVLSFHEGSNKYLLNLKKGSKVYVEANFELREPEPDADPSTPQGQRQIFLRHESLRVLSQPKPRDESDGSGSHEGF